MDVGSDKAGSISTAGLAIGLGKQRVFLDRFTFGYGFQMSVPFKIKEVPFFDETSPVETKIDNKAITRLFLKSIFEVKVSFGVLAF